jgi:hypothetical protein
MRVIASLVTGLALTVAPARADVEQVPIAFMANAVCDLQGSPCVVTRADIVHTNIALFLADAHMKHQAEVIQAQAEVIDELREELQTERGRGPHCAEVRKIPVPGTRS